MVGKKYTMRLCERKRAFNGTQALYFSRAVFIILFHAQVDFHARCLYSIQDRGEDRREAVRRQTHIY